MIQESPLLQAKDLSLNFGGLTALSEVNFVVGKGEIFGLAGPNGAGKTCILNVINKVYPVDKGQCMFEGINLLDLPGWRIIQLGIGRTFQQLELFRSMTVTENILLGCHYMTKGGIFSQGVFWGPYRKQEIKAVEQAEEVMDFLELWRYRKKAVGSLPFGVQKLVGIARALAANPQLLLLDEPSSGMTRQEKEDLARYLLRIKYELGKAMIWVEHDVQLVSDVADRLMVLAYGKKIAEGNPDKVLSNPQVEEAFLGASLKQVHTMRP